MSTKVKVPKPTAEELALRGEQTALLRQQRELIMDQHKQQQALLPIFAKQLGLDISFDSNGNISATEINDPLDSKRKEIQGLELDRSLAALKGELPVDPALERNLSEQREKLTGRLRDQLGTGFETSSAGIEALQKYEDSAESLRYGARRGELTLAEQLSLARQGADAQTGGSNRGQLQSFLNQPMQIAGGLGSVASGFQMPIGQMINQRQMQFDANMQNSRNTMGGLGVLGDIFGTAIGAVPFSDRRLKTNIQQIGMFGSIPLYTYTLWHTGEDRIGVMAQDLQAIGSDAVVEIDGVLHVDYKRL